jgi:processive 1,2-diacylglycerol beta-glucosyltransferase
MRALILHASAGAGHRRAAEALAGAFAIEQPQAEIVVADILDYTPRLFRETYADGYLRLVRRVPELWGYMYAHSDRTAGWPWQRKVRSAFNRINVTALARFLKKFNPDLVIATHFMALEVLSTRARRHKPAVPFYGVVTDFAVHSLWVVEGVACYYVANEEARRQLLRRGQPADRVAAGGIPIDPAFARSADRAGVLQRLGLDPARNTILLASGGHGVGSIPGIIRSFAGTDLRCQLIVVTGSNASMREAASREAGKVSIPVAVLGLAANMHELMDAADLIVGKSGGLTCSEALAKGKPMIVTDPIPGQEQRNCEHLLECGAAVRLYETEDAPYRIRALLKDPGRLEQMKTNALRLGRPNAARDIVRDILSRYTQDHEASAISLNP